MIHNEQEYRTMFDLELRLWWYRVLYEKIKKSLLGMPRNSEILDIGCGTGGIIKYLMDLGFQKTRGIDISPVSIKVCNERGLPAESADAFSYLKGLKDSSLDAILFIDSFTYISVEKQNEVIKECYRVLRPNGRLILNSAALKVFRGIHDEHVGTVCRLNKKNYRAYSAASGLSITKMHYWPFLLGVPILILRTIQRYKLKNNKNVEWKTDLEMPPHWLNELFYRLTKTEEYFSGLSIFGSSLFGVFVKSA